jgi:ubiquinone/menaquinone biosynthesis C-methylase UbiE
MADPIRLEPTGDHDATRAYYDEFSARYDARRGGREPGGYHDLVDDLEVGYTRRFAVGRDVLEVGCGTGLLLARIAAFARSAKGIDLSPGMLAHARERGLDVTEGSATSLPFPDASFDVVCSFKVLAHVREIDVALREMARVTRPGGTVLAEFYNPTSVRALVKRFGPAGKISDRAKEDRVFTRFDGPRDVERILPPDLRVVGTRGVRIVTPAAVAMRVPVLGRLLAKAEHALCDSPLRAFGGFVVYALRKR